MAYAHWQYGMTERNANGYSGRRQPGNHSWGSKGGAPCAGRKQVHREHGQHERGCYRYDVDFRVATQREYAGRQKAKRRGDQQESEGRHCAKGANFGLNPENSKGKTAKRQLHRPTMGAEREFAHQLMRWVVVMLKQMKGHYRCDE